MKKHIVLSFLAAGLMTLCAGAATPEQEKAFVDAYRKALEAGDQKTLEGFLYTKGAQKEQIEFFKMMMTGDPGSKIKSIELVKPSAEEAAELNQPMEMPDGKTYKLPLTPVKQLVITSEHKSASGSSTSTSKQPVAESGGKLVIPVPVPATAAPAKPAKPAKGEKGATKK